MANPIYPIGPEIFERRERELRSRLPELYPNENDRHIAGQVLVPQLRSVVAEALSNFAATRGELASVPPTPAELPNLCAKVDKILNTNRNLLDAEGLGKQMFDYVRSVRRSVRAEMKEAFKGHCRSLLAAHGITDRATLIAKGSKWFEGADFPPYGKGRAFAGFLLGKAVFRISLDHFFRLAVILGIPDVSDLNRQKYRDAFAVYGITDRATLLAKGPIWFQKADFPPYGKGFAFARHILNERVHPPTLNHLRRIADILGWSEESEVKKLPSYRDALAAHGVTDRATLLAKGAMWFLRSEFPPYGKGIAFAGRILGERVDYPSVSHLRRIADILGWPESSPEEKIQGYRDNLAAHGITDRATLLAKGPIWFVRASFPPYGKGCAFAGLVLGETVNRVTLDRLRRIADILFPDKK